MPASKVYEIRKEFPLVIPCGRDSALFGGWLGLIGCWCLFHLIKRKIEKKGISTRFLDVKQYNKYKSTA